MINYSLVIVLLSVCVAFSTFGQETKRTYEVVAVGDAANIADYHEALNGFDLDPYRLISERRKIIFKSGVEIELLSVETLEQQYGRVRSRTVMNRLGDEETYPWLWELDANGNIVDKRRSSVSAQIENHNESPNLQNSGE